jgi:16S rRNA (guanine966-N2)-methyltransferase
MKVVSGIYRNRKLETLEGNNTRPTLSRIKENIMNLVRSDLNTRTSVLDLFAGSGSMGIEFISNYVERVDFVENSDLAINIIQKNILNLQIKAEKISISKIDYAKFLESTKKEYDIIFVDPPFDSDYSLILENIVKSAACGNNTTIIVESDKSRNLDFSKFNIVKSKNYGIINISLIKVRGER